MEAQGQRELSAYLDQLRQRQIEEAERAQRQSDQFLRERLNEREWELSYEV